MAASITLSLDSKPAIAALQAYSRAMAGEMQNTERQVKSAGEKIFTFNQAWEATSRVLGKVKQAFELVNAAFQQVVVKTAAADEQIGAFSQSIFASVEQATKLDLVGKRFNITQEQMAQGLKGLTNKLGEAGNGSAEAQAVFDKLGIKIRDVNTGALRPASDVMLDVADRFQKMGTSSEKTAAAIKLFEEGGLKLIPMLNQGSAGIQKMGDHFERLGITATTSSVQMATEFSRNWRTLDLMFEGVVSSLGRKLMPAFVQASDAAIKYGEAMIRGIDWSRVISFIGGLTEKVGLLTQFTTGLITPFAALADALQFGLLNALSLVVKMMSAIPDVVSKAAGAMEQIARAVGSDGLADSLASARQELNILTEGLDETATEISGWSIDIHEAGVGAIQVLGDVGKGMEKLGGDIQKNTKDSTSAVKETTSAISDMGKGGSAAASTIERTVGPAMSGVTKKTKEFQEATKEVNLSAQEAYELGIPKYVEYSAQAIDGLGKRAKAAVKELGTVSFSLSKMVIKSDTTSRGTAVSVPGFQYAGKLGDNPIPSYQQLLKSGKGAGGGWGDPGYGSITGGFNNDPFLSAFAMSNPGAATDLLTGRANAITGDRYNQYVQDLINEPYNQAAGDWMREQAAAQQEARMRSSQETAARLNAQQAAGMAKVAEAEEAARTRTGSSFDSTIPTSVDTTIAKVKELEQAFRQVNAAVETADQTMARLAENAARSVFRTTENIAPGVLSTSGARPGIIQQQLATNNPAAKLVASIQNPSVSSYGGNQSYDSIMTRGLVR